MKRIFLVLFFLVWAGHAGFGQSAGVRSWAEAQRAGKATVYVYWYESRPFIYKNENGEMEGIEQEILSGFKDYVREKYKVELTLQWKETKNFENTYQTLCDETLPGSFWCICFFHNPAA
jgi:hypothetical protein